MASESGGLFTKLRSGFVSDVMKLISGTTLAQIISIVVMPILTRLYSPEAFGVLAIYSAIVSVVGEVSCFGYDRAVMLPEDDRDAERIVVISIILSAAISVLCVPLFMVFGRQLSFLIGTQGETNYLWLVPPAVLITGIFIVLNQWNSRKKLYGRLSIVRVINSIISSAGQIAAGFAGFTASIFMIVASIIGTVSSTIYLIVRSLGRGEGRGLLQGLYWIDVKVLIYRYKKFPLFDTWSTIINSISWQLPVIMLAGFFSPVEAGYYALGNRVLRMPMNLIGSSMAQVFYQRAAQAKLDGSLTHLVKGVFKRLVSFGLFPTLLLAFIGGDLFVTFFGNNWIEAGIYTQILSVWTFFWFISSPLSSLFYVHEKQGMLLAINGMILLTRIASLWIGGALGNARLAVTLFAASGIIVYGYLGIFMLLTSKVSVLNICRIFGANTAAFIPACAVLLLLKGMHASACSTVIVSMFVLLGYFLFATWNDLYTRSLLLGLLKYLKGIARRNLYEHV